MSNNLSISCIYLLFESIKTKVGYPKESRSHVYVDPRKNKEKITAKGRKYTAHAIHFIKESHSKDPLCHVFQTK